MNIKEMLYRSLMTFFVLVTFITAGIMILGLAFDPDAKFGYDAYFSPFVFAFLGVLPNLIIYSSKELSNKQIIVRKLIQLAVIEAEVIGVCMASPLINTEKDGVIAGVSVSVFVIFILTNFVIIINDYFSAKKLTKDLMRFQENVK